MTAPTSTTPKGHEWRRPSSAKVCRQWQQTRTVARCARRARPAFNRDMVAPIRAPGGLLRKDKGFGPADLRDGPKPAKAIFREAREAGHSERTIKRAKAELQAESIKEKAGWVWALPVKSAKGANSANDSKAQTAGTVANGAKVASDSPLGSLGTLADAGEVL